MSSTPSSIVAILPIAIFNAVSAGAVLVTFKLLGYRVILAGDMSGVNILDLLGPIERCQITIAEDELDNLEDDEDKQRIYKMGYEDIGLVTRTVDPSSSDRTIRFYNPFGIKFFAGEKAPDSKQLGGFNDRTFRSEAKKGRPKLLMEDNSIFLTEDPFIAAPRANLILYNLFIIKVTITD